MVSFAPRPAGAGVREVEPNDGEHEGMVLSPGMAVDCSWSFSRSKETRRGTDRDSFALSQFVYPGTYTFKVTPSASECRYSFGITHLRGPFTGPVTLTVQVEGDRVSFRYSGGGQTDYQYTVSERDPLNGKRLIIEPTFWNSDFHGGFQCSRDGAVRQEIPYQLTVSRGGAPAGAEPGPSAVGVECRPEIEPNDQDNEAMGLTPPSCIEGGWSFARSRQTNRGTDRDVYRLSGFRYPGTYVFTVAPSVTGCRYHFGLGNMRGPFSGTVSLTVQVAEQNQVNVTYSGGGAPEYRYSTTLAEPLNGKLLFLEPVLYNSNKDGGFQCVKDGSTYQDILYRLNISMTAAPGAAQHGGQTSAATPIRETARRPQSAGHEISLDPGMSWEGELAEPALLKLAARIQWKEVAGAASVLEVRLNGQPVTGSLVNKGTSFRLADGREFPYYADSVRAWTIFYSPDFSLNNTAAAGGYQVVSDPGQAYLYQWNTGLIGGPPIKITLRHNGLVKAPVMIRIW